MTEQTAENTEIAPPKGNMTLMTAVILAIFVIVIIIAECCLAYLCMPSAEQILVARMGQYENVMDFPVDPEDENYKEQFNVPSVEKELGQYNVTAHQQISNTTLHISFNLCGTVPVENEKEFNQLYQKNTNRIRDQVLTTVRCSDVSDLTDGGLDLIKRKLEEKINAVLGKQLVHKVLFSEFSCDEQ